MEGFTPVEGFEPIADGGGFEPLPPEPGSAPAHAIPADIWNVKGKTYKQGLGATDADTRRMQASFGNAAGIHDKLKELGYQDTHQMPDGSVAVQGSDGKWYKDQTNFFPSEDVPGWDALKKKPLKELSKYFGSAHPVNWVENKQGPSLPTLGWLSGAGAGGAAGALAGGFGAPAGAVAGAGVGGALGEAARIGVGTQNGYYKPESALGMGADIGNEALQSMTGEMGGRLLGAIPIYKGGLREHTPAQMRINPQVGSASEFSLPHVTRGSGYSYLEQPKIARAGESFSPVGVDPRRATLEDGLAVGIQKMLAAGKMVTSKLSSAMTDVPEEAVTRLIDRPTQVLNPPSNQRVSTAANQEMGFEGGGTGRWSEEGQRIQNARRQFAEQHGDKDVDTSKIIGNVQDTLDHTPQTEGGKGLLSPAERDELTKIQREDLSTPTQVPYGSDSDPYGGPRQESYLPTKKAGSLQALTDWISTQLGNKFGKNPTAVRTALEDAQLKRLRGATKEELHALSPDYTAADDRYHNFRKDASMVSPLFNEKQSEGYAGRLFGANKTKEMEAASRAVPDTFDTLMQDRAASDEFNKSTPLDNLLPTRRNMLARMLGIGAAGAGYATGEGIPGAVVGIGGAAAATSPWVHKQVIGRAAQMMEAFPWMQALGVNGQLPATLARPKTDELYNWMHQNANPWVQGDQNGQK